MIICVKKKKNDELLNLSSEISSDEKKSKDDFSRNK